MAHKLPDLPYDINALEPYIDATTMSIHHDKHHQAYVNNLNAALEGHPELQEKTALDLVKSEAISLAFVDINLPDMSGVEVMQEMRNRIFPFCRTYCRK